MGPLGPVHDSLPSAQVSGFRELLRSLGRTCIETVFPTVCPSCRVGMGPLAESPWCDACGESILALTSTEYCERCGRTTGPFERREDRCGECRNSRSPLSGLVRVGPHKDPLRGMLLDFKFRRAPLDHLLGGLLASAVAGAAWRARIEGLVPIPMHWYRKLTRGHHHTRTLAHPCGDRLSLPVAEVLRRTRRDPPQVGLSKAQRLGNIRGAFAVVRGARLTGKTLCLIDDVTTTGATLTEAAKTLLKGGAQEVYAAVLTKSDSLFAA